MFKLPDVLRPYFGKVVGGVLTIGLTIVGKKIPGIEQIISPDAVDIATGVIITWLFGSSISTVIDAKTNPTGSKTGDLAKSVPASVVSKDVGPIYIPKPGDKI
jgi:hypothetical protein